MNLLPTYAEINIERENILNVNGSFFAPSGFYNKTGSIYTYEGKQGKAHLLSFIRTRVWIAPSGRVISLGGDNPSNEWTWSLIPILERLEEMEVRIKVLETRLIDL